ncbi:hypothetical protein [Streptomyces sp. NRRL S-495]|uniref:hypothetical protein n=1 Tax=Streptomyces sp. NRRL S-495 TaxID=1609133 RepID=UPI000A6BC4A4|nr:hypothetical protein [Streptomyces sp. NRRL S-495]
MGPRAPSCNRSFVEPALNAYGYRRVRAELLDRLVDGTDAQRAGAARAWHWTALPLDPGGPLGDRLSSRGGRRPHDARHPTRIHRLAGSVVPSVRYSSAEASAVPCIG